MGVTLGPPDKRKARDFRRVTPNKPTPPINRPRAARKNRRHDWSPALDGASSAAPNTLWKDVQTTVFGCVGRDFIAGRPVEAGGRRITREKQGRYIRLARLAGRRQ